MHSNGVLLFLWPNIRLNGFTIKVRVPWYVISDARSRFDLDQLWVSDGGAQDHAAGVAIDGHNGVRLSTNRASGSQ
jgi:hypothetical protein